MAVLYGAFASPFQAIEPMAQGILILFTPMPTIKLSVPHRLGTAEAKKRITNLIADARAQFGASAGDVQESWTGDTNYFSFRAMGFSVSGNMTVRPDAVDGELKLPLAALPFKSRIESELATRAKTLLA